MVRTPLLIPALFLVLVAWPADGQETTAPDVNESDLTIPDLIPPLQVDFRAGVWLARLKNTTRLGGPRLDLDDDLRLRDREPALNGELTILKNRRWHLQFSGTDFSVSERSTFRSPSSVFGGLQLDPGDTYRASVEITSLGAEVGYTVDRFPESADQAELRLSPTLGIRWVNVNHEIEEVGVGTESLGGTWLALMVGGQFSLDLHVDHPLVERFEIRGQVGLGPAVGGDGGSMWELRAGVTAFFTRHVGVSFGFRLLELDVERDGWEFDGGLQGLFLSGTIRFSAIHP